MSLRKSFWNFLTPEDHLHNACCQYLTMQYRDVLFLHVPNEGKRSEFERFKATFLFIKAGAPDIFIYRANKLYHGLACEMKSRTGTLSAQQREWLLKLQKEGWKACVINDVEVFKKTIDEYLLQK